MISMKIEYAGGAEIKRRNQGILFTVSIIIKDRVVSGYEFIYLLLLETSHWTYVLGFEVGCHLPQALTP